MSDNTLVKDAIVIERTFDAPVALIWQMWTHPDHLTQWYGPQGFSVTVIEMDVRVGGKHLFCMQTPDGGMKMWLVGEYTEVVANERLVYTDSMADENGNIVEMDNDDYPAITVVTVLLEDQGERTKMTMTHAGVPTDNGGASEGWQQAFNSMADYVEVVLNGK